MTDIQRAKQSCDTALKDFMSGRLSYEDYKDIVSVWELHLERLITRL